MDFLDVLREIAVFVVPAIAGIFIAKYYQKKKPKITSEGKIAFYTPGYYKIVGILTLPFFIFISIMAIIQEGIDGLGYILLLGMLGLVSISVWLIYWSFSNKVLLDQNKVITSRRLFKKDVSTHFDDLEEVTYNKFSGNYTLKFKNGNKIRFSGQFIGRKYFFQILISEYKSRISPKALKHIEKDLSGDVPPMI